MTASFIFSVVGGYKCYSNILHNMIDRYNCHKSKEKFKIRYALRGKREVFVPATTKGSDFRNKRGTATSKFKIRVQMLTMT